MPFTDPALDLQKAIVAALKADADVAAIVGDRVFDIAPTNAPRPYVSLGLFQLIPSRADCFDGGETFVQIDGWTNGPDTVVCKRLGKAIADVLDEGDLAVDGNRLVLMQIDQIQYLRDPDGQTMHAAITLRAITDPL